MILEIRYFRQGRREPVAEYIDEVKDADRNAAAKIEQHIMALAAEGPTSPTIICRHLSRGLWELKVRTRMGQHRIFYCVEGGIIWLLHAITKKSPKTPLDDLAVATKRMKEVQG